MSEQEQTLAYLGTAPQLAPVVTVVKEGPQHPLRPAADAPREDAPDLTAVLDAALAGDASAMRILVRELRPTVEAEVAATLHRRAPWRSGRDPRQERHDMIQEVFLALLSENARSLRAWRPCRGRTLPSFVRLLARHEVVSILRSGRRSPWTEDPTAIEDMGETPSEHLEDQLANVDEARRILERLRSELGTRSMLLFEALYVEQRSVQAVCNDFEMTREALYAWRSRLRKRTRALVRRMRRGSP
ncbi:MAG: hypothetical protein AAFZ18_30145 [Myxococcota bacterium]